MALLVLGACVLFGILAILLVFGELNDWFDSFDD